MIWILSQEKKENYISLFAEDPYDAKYQLLVNKKDKTGFEWFEWF